MLAVFKFLFIFFFIFVFMLHALLIWLWGGDIWTLRKRWTSLISAYSRLGLRIMGVHVHLRGNGRQSPQGQLIVGNHLGYLDVLVIASQWPSCFVTSQEIRETPLLGQVCTLAGCLFVERRNKSQIQNEIGELTQALKQDLNVVVFPEATSGNGEGVLRFRRPLYHAALNSQKDVIPICLNYRSIDGQKLTSENRDTLFWYGKMAFAPHLWKLMQARYIEVDLHLLEPIPVQNSLEVSDLADRSYQAVVNAFNPVLSP